MVSSSAGSKAGLARLAVDTKRRETLTKTRRSWMQVLATMIDGIRLNIRLTESGFLTRLDVGWDQLARVWIRPRGHTGEKDAGRARRVCLLSPFRVIYYITLSSTSGYTHVVRQLLTI